MKKVIILMLLSAVIWSCNKEAPRRSLLAGYKNMAGINLHIDNFALENGFKLICVDGIPNVSFTSDEYNELCQKHSDVSYNRTGNRNLYCIGVDFIGIDIFSDSDFDENHKAGTLLNDIVQCYAISPYQFILSKYKAYYNWSDAYFEFPFLMSYPGGVNVGIFYRTYKKVSELESTDMIMMLDLPQLCFISEPTIAKTHNITVTMTADDGRVFSDTVQVTWE